MNTYEYNGLIIRVPTESRYIAVGADGVIRAYTKEPSNGDERAHTADAAPVTVLNNDNKAIALAGLKKFDPIVLTETAAPHTALYEIGDTLTLQSSIDDEKVKYHEVHVVVSCYSPDTKPWTQVLRVKVNGLSIDNITLTTITDILYQYHA